MTVDSYTHSPVHACTYVSGRPDDVSADPISRHDESLPCDCVLTEHLSETCPVPYVAAFPEWVRGLSRWADVGRVPGWLPAFAAHAGFEVGLRGYQPGRSEAFDAAVETSRRMRAWLGDPGPHTLVFVRAAHDGAGPFASMPFPIRAMLSGVLQFEPGCGGVARQIDPDGMSSAGHVLGWSARNGEAPVREEIQRSLIAWALSPGEP